MNRNDQGNNTAAVVARLRTNELVLKMLQDDRFGVFLQNSNTEHTDNSPAIVPMQEVTEIIGRVVRIIHDPKPSAP